MGSTAASQHEDAGFESLLLYDCWGKAPDPHNPEVDVTGWMEVKQKQNKCIRLI